MRETCCRQVRTGCARAACRARRRRSATSPCRCRCRGPACRPAPTPRRRRRAHARRRRHAMRRIGAGRHAPADQHIAVAHRARLARAARPAERLGALAIAFAQRLAGERPVLVRVLFRHSCAGGTRAGPSSAPPPARRSPIRARSCRSPGRARACRSAGLTCVATSRCVTATFGQAYSISVASPTGSLNSPSAGSDICEKPSCRIDDQLSLLVGGEAQLLHRARPIAVGGEHLRACHHQLHRPADHLRRHRRERRRRPGVALAAEAAADIGADHADIRGIDAEQSPRVSAARRRSPASPSRPSAGRRPSARWSRAAPSDCDAPSACVGRSSLTGAVGERRVGIAAAANRAAARHCGSSSADRPGRAPHPSR